MMLLLFGYTFSLYMTHLSLIGSNNLILEITTGRNESREKETHLYSIALALNCVLLFFFYSAFAMKNQAWYTILVPES